MQCQAGQRILAGEAGLVGDGVPQRGEVPKDEAEGGAEPLPLAEAVVQEPGPGGIAVGQNGDELAQGQAPSREIGRGTSSPRRRG